MQQAYLDESGYTGRDLLNAEQPFMVLSALFITEEEASSLRSKYFQNIQADELKHKTLARRPTYWKALLNLQHECLHKYRGISFVAEKRYLCILKFLDDCIEPVFHAKGIDFYQNGHSISLASLLYFSGPVFFGTNNFDDLLRFYCRASVTKQPDDIDALCEHAKTLRDQKLGYVLSPITQRHPAFLETITSSETTTNVAFSMLMGLIDQLEDCSGGPYSITHDTSPAMQAYHTKLEQLIQIKEKAAFQISKVAKSSFPLKLQDIEEADSKVYSGLQLADILAGGIAEGVKQQSGLVNPNDYNTKVTSLYSDHNFMHMFPIKDQQQIKESFKDTEMASAIDFLSSSASSGA